jgi:putative hydrolase of the HAD superfamily
MIGKQGPGGNCVENRMFDLIGIDADDTLWHNEPLYTASRESLQELLAGHINPEALASQLYETEMRNLHLYGYGIKSFALSMIETAARAGPDTLPREDVLQIIDWAKGMISSPVHLLPGVEETLRALHRSHLLILVTKGDLKDQRAKLDRSGIGAFFRYVEVVSDKDEDTYRALLDRYEVEPHCFLMVGNSVRSDVLPVVAIGGRAVHIPYKETWDHEKVPPHQVRDKEYYELGGIDQLPGLLERLCAAAESSPVSRFGGTS